VCFQKLLQITLGLSQTVTNFLRRYCSAHGRNAPLFIRRANERRRREAISAAKLQEREQGDAMAFCE
jgi:hypothetical protein